MVFRHTYVVIDTKSILLLTVREYEIHIICRAIHSGQKQMCQCSD